jgi:UDP-glucose 6-dehydrogenase
MGNRFICMDNDEAKLKTFSQGGVPIFEEQLPPIAGKT